jgi:hypothetical protein
VGDPAASVVLGRSDWALLHQLPGILRADLDALLPGAREAVLASQNGKTGGAVLLCRNRRLR